MDGNLGNVRRDRVEKGTRLTRRIEYLLIILIFILALGVRLKFAWPALTGEQGFVAGDDDDYYRLAISLLKTGRLEDGGSVAYRMPFFPMVLAANYAAFGTSPYAAQPFIVLLSALTCVGVYILGKSWFNVQVGLLAGLLSTIDFSLAFYSGLLMTETLMVFVVLGSMIALEQIRRTESWQWAIIAGSLMGLATLTRVNFGVYVPVALGWLMLIARNRRMMLRNSILIILLVGSLWLAWILRNYMELGALVPFTTQSGNGYYGIYNDIAADRSRLIEYGQWVWIIPSPPDVPGKQWNEVELDRMQQEWAFGWIRSHPEQALEVALMQVFHLWRPEILQDLYLLPFLFFAASIGLRRALRQKSQAVVLWILAAAVFTVMAVVSLATPRFRLPLHPGLTVLAALAITTSWQKIATKLPVSGARLKVSD